MLSNDIKAHFDEEIRLKRKVFDAEIQYDDIEEKVTAMANEANMSEDKAMTRRYEDLLNTKKRLALLVDDAQREYSMVGAKRNFLQAVFSFLEFENNEQKIREFKKKRIKIL